MQSNNSQLDEKVYLALLIPVGILSIIGSLTIILNYIRNYRTAQLAQQLLLLLAIGDLCYVVGNLSYPNPKYDNVLCKFQAFLKQVGSQTSFLSSYWLIYTTYKSLVKHEEMSRQYKRVVKMTCIVIPIITASIPLIDQGYERDIFSCGFKTDGLNQLNPIILFFCPFVILMTLSLIAFCKTRDFLIYIRRSTPIIKGSLNRKLIKRENSEIQFTERITQYLLYYPLIQCFCWAPYSVYEIWKFVFFEDSDLIYLAGLRFIFACLQGFGDSLVHHFSTKYSKLVLVYQTGGQDAFQSMVSEFPYDNEEEDDVYRGSVTASNFRYSNSQL